MSVVGYVREHIKTCPLLKPSASLGVDFIAENGTAYMIEAVPSEPIIRRYINGDTLRQFVFAFSTKEAYGNDAELNASNVSFLEEFGDWLTNSPLSPMGDGKEASSFEILSTGYAYNVSVSSAIYRTQFRLIYKKEA